MKLKIRDGNLNISQELYVIASQYDELIVTQTRRFICANRLVGIPEKDRKFSLGRSRCEIVEPSTMSWPFV